MQVCWSNAHTASRVSLVLKLMGFGRACNMQVGAKGLVTAWPEGARRVQAVQEPEDNIVHEVWE
jgi:hypothetical protein